MRRILRLGAVILACFLSFVLAAPATAQQHWGDRHETYLIGNVVLAGGTALVRSLWSGADPVEAFLKGAAGGVVAYTGQRLAGTGRTEVLFVGHQVTAIGTNIARNAGDGVPLLSDLILPLYPFYVRVRPGSEEPVRIQLSSSSLRAIGFAFLYSPNDEWIDWRLTLLMGVPVFRSEHERLRYWKGEAATCPAVTCGTNRWAFHHSGTLTLGSLYDGGSARGRYVLGHEMVHVTQATRARVLEAVDLSDHVLGAIGLGRFSRWFVLDDLTFHEIAHFIRTPGIHATSGSNVNELEADAMTGRGQCRDRSNVCPL